ncbi:UNVERIFIED_CONTAM: hypothetical protein HDU68_003771 [Siphonaria sp. JEL0065]|nr:hypothetical protein HDU68_003771 [Siphonaria sp. JEL0065]
MSTTATVPATIDLVLAEMLALKAEVTMLRSEHKLSQAQFRAFLERFEAGEFGVVSPANNNNTKSAVGSSSQRENAYILRSPRQRGAGPAGASVLPPIELPTRKRKASDPAVVALPTDTPTAVTAYAAPKSPAKRKIVTAEIQLDEKVDGAEKAEAEVVNLEAPRKRGRPRKDAVSVVDKEAVGDVIKEVSTEKDVSGAVPNRSSSRQAASASTTSNAPTTTPTVAAPLANSAATNTSASTSITASTSTASGNAGKKSVEVVSTDKGKRGRPSKTVGVDYIPYDRKKDPNATWHSALATGMDIEVFSKGAWYKAKATHYVPGPNEFKLKVHFPGYGKQYDELINVLSEEGRSRLRQIELE